MNGVPADYSQRKPLNGNGYDNAHSKFAPHVLVVDDLPENAEILKAFLSPKGFAVASVFSGTAAIEEIKKNPPDVILLDLVMPDMDGFEVCRRVKQDANTRHIPIIVITGLAEREANVQAIEAGADDFLLKPFDAVLLEARIRTSLRSKMLQDQIIDYQNQLVRYNQSLEACVRDRTAQLERTQQVAVFSLAKLAESRDTETGEHLERMRSYAREVALQLIESNAFPDLESDLFVDALFHSSPLHDIGKVGIPDRILLKPGKLTTEEFEIMKSHTLIGGDTLRAADQDVGQDSFLAMGRDIAYFHHEKWDGSGYPMGLRGDRIPLPARIVAIADVYDALTSKRPYKRAFTHEESKQIILEGRGAHFDPAIVDAFLAREERFVLIGKRFKDTALQTPIMRFMERLDQVEGEQAEMRKEA